MYLVTETYNKFFNPTDTSLPSPKANLDSLRKACNDSLTLSALQHLTELHTREMASDHSGARKFATSTIHAALMVGTSAVLGISESTYRVGTTVVTGALLRKSPTFMPLDTVVTQATKSFTTLTASVAGCFLAVQCLTKKNLSLSETLSQTSLGLIDLSKPLDNEEDPTEPVSPPPFVTNEDHQEDSDIDQNPS